MAAFKIASVTASVVFLLAVSRVISDSPCPPENPFCPVWVPCNYTEVKGPYCQDCNTRVICTAVGGLVQPCWFPGINHCVDGQCRREPGPGCEPPTEEPPTEEPPTEEPPTEAPPTEVPSTKEPATEETETEETEPEALSSEDPNV